MSRQHKKHFISNQMISFGRLMDDLKGSKFNNFSQSLQIYQLSQRRNYKMRNNDETDLYEFNPEELKVQFNKAVQILLKVSPISQDVKHYNKFIIEKLKDYKCLDILLSLLIEAGGDNSKCSLIISFIAHYLKIQVKLGVLPKNQHNKCDIYQKIKSLFFCNTITEKHKKMLKKHFSEFLSTLTPQFIKVRRLLCEEIVKYFLNENNITSNDLSNILYLIQAVLTPSLQSDSLRLLEQSLLMNFVRLSLSQIRNVDQILTKSENINLSQEEQNKIIWASKVHKITLLLFVSANHDKVVVLKHNVVISSEMANICFISLLLSKDRKSFMLNHNDSQLFNQINEIKLCTLKIMNDFLKSLVKSKRNLSDLKYAPVLETVKFFLDHVIISAFANQFLVFPEQSLPCQELGKYAILILSLTTQIPCLLDIHTRLRDLAVFNFCLISFLTTSKDRQMCAEDFCNMKEKIVDHDNSAKNIQQAASVCLEAYADNIYGTVPYVVKSLINLMEFQLTADPQHYEKIPQLLVKSKFFTSYKYQEQIEVSLSVLAILSYQADHRDDIGPVVEQFVIRRQIFFSRVDLPSELIVGFFHFFSYYLENFYSLILEGRGNQNFHRAFIFHSIQVLKFCYNPDRKDFQNNEKKKIGIQALDFVSNAVIQPFFFSAIFPAWNPQSPQMLVNLMQNICCYFDSNFNINLLQNTLIDFATRVIDRHFPEQNNFIGMPEVLRNQLCVIFVENIIKNFNKDIKNESVARIKMLELYSLIIRFSVNPNQLIEMSRNLFTHIVQTQYTFMDELINLIQLFARRVVNEKISISEQTGNILASCAIKAMKVCYNQTFQTIVFDLVLHLNMLRICQEDIALCLVQVFEQNLKQKDVDQSAQIIMEKALYLLLQIAYSNFNQIRSLTWVNIFQKILDFLKNNYVMRDTITVGKAVCICLCCYAEDPNGVSNYLGNRNEGFWDCVLDDQLKYNSETEKKIFCIVLCNLMMKHSSQKTINDKFDSILRSVCIILYYIYQKGQLSFKQDDLQSNQSDKSESEKVAKKDWQEVYETMRSNVFLSSLPDQRALIKDICLKVNEINHQSFQRFIADLPIGIQNLVKNKIMMYREDSAVAKKTKMRTIYKVKRIEEE